MATLAYQPQENPLVTLLGRMGIPAIHHAGLQKLLQFIHPDAPRIAGQILSDPNLQFTAVGSISGPAASEEALRQLLQSGPKTPSGPGSLTGLPAERPWVGVKPITSAEGQAPLTVPKSYTAPKVYDLTNEVAP